ncbi:Nucleic acid dioxygenase ALKBH1 [Pseudolycoriella hygida]|uniref:Nucleic acid dioxygenase ALKBH1 n=1 Tax=Pseudolycoriella hygida TaxID=35572 RepID=A0A9Q0MVZ7_9DIPT|nr:Nucleic acid dioxygenase ALKBH1 [Pseudolycoriella hygida]
MFTESFKYYKSKNPPPSFESVINFDGVNDSIFVRRTVVNNSDERFRHIGLTDPIHWQIFESPSGLIFIKNPFTAQGQRYWIARCLSDYPKSPHANNLHSKSISLSVVDDWWKELNSTETKAEKERLRTALRWCTLGYHHQWDTKIYSEDKKHEFPSDLASLSGYIANVLNFGKYSAEAAIINFYPIGSTLSAHTDHSEQNLDAPLFSFSFGQSAIFLIGGTTKDIKPMAMLLQSGDIVVMSQESRLCYHAVPRVFKSDLSTWNLEEKDEDDDYREVTRKRRRVSQQSDHINTELWDLVLNKDFWQPFNEYVDNCRINANVRQVLREGQNTL